MTFENVFVDRSWLDFAKALNKWICNFIRLNSLSLDVQRKNYHSVTNKITTKHHSCWYLARSGDHVLCPLWTVMNVIHCCLRHKISINNSLDNFSFIFIFLFFCIRFSYLLCYGIRCLFRWMKFIILTVNYTFCERERAHQKRSKWESIRMSANCSIELSFFKNWMCFDEGIYVDVQWDIKRAQKTQSNRMKIVQSMWKLQQLNHQHSNLLMF